MMVDFTTYPGTQIVLRLPKVQECSVFNILAY